MSHLLNVLLDGFPKEYLGYPINTDFRIGIMLSLLLEDDTIDDEELRLMHALTLLYKDKVPEDMGIAMSGLYWFLSCGKSEIYYDEDEDNDDSSDKSIDFNVDHLDIWAAFYKLGVDLEQVNMHWFKFCSLLGSLGDCALSQKAQYRTVDLSDMTGETKKYYAKLKRKYKVRKLISKEEYDAKLKEIESTYGSYYMKLRELNKK